MSVPRAPTGGGVLSVREAPALSRELAIERLARALEECVEFDELRDIADAATAAEGYFRQRAASLEMQNKAAMVRLRAERKLGEFLRSLQIRRGPKDKSDTPVRNPALKDLGITYRQSSMWQRIAAVETQDFDSRCRDAFENGLELTTARVLGTAKPAADAQRTDRAETKAQASSSLPKPDDDADAEDIAAGLIDRLGPLKAQDVADEINRQLHT